MSNKRKDSAMLAFSMGGNRMSPEEEQPTMRSVALLPGPPTLTPLAAPEGFKLGKGPVFGTPRPKGGISASPTSFSVAQEWTETVSAASWDVKGEDLDLVPADFPLERTHREINCDASEVAKRISSSLQKMSIDAQYDNENAKAKCKTMECVKFRIRLYAGGDNGQPVIVEVQRRSGSTSSFMRSCRQLLDAAEGAPEKSEESVSTTTSTVKSIPPLKVNLSSMKCLQSVSVPGPGLEEQATIAFDSAAILCKSKKRDSVILGLQSLCNLTDPLKTSFKVSAQVSRWILLGHETHTTRDDISAILQVVLDEDDDELHGIVEQQKHFAFITLANSLDICAKDGSLSKAITDHTWFESLLVPALLNALTNKAESPGNAYAATRGIVSLVSSSEDAARIVEESNVTMLLRDVRQYGLQCHELLAGESARCLELLGRMP